MKLRNQCNLSKNSSTQSEIDEALDNIETSYAKLNIVGVDH